MARDDATVAPTASSPAYFARTVAPVQIAVGVASGVLVGLILVALDRGLWPFAIAAFVLAAASGVFLGAVSLTVDGDQVLIGQGRAEREPRMIYVGEVAACEPARLTWAQCFGMGMPRSWRVTALAVRRGPTLSLRLTDGELVRISVPDPAAAIAAMGLTPSPVTPLDEDVHATSSDPAGLDALLADPSAEAAEPDTGAAGDAPPREEAPLGPAASWEPPPAPPSRQPPPQRPRPRPRPK